jgi:membrane-associated phospholipid phosphatase
VSFHGDLDPPTTGRALAIILGVYAAATFVTALLAHAIGSPFELWFWDSAWLLAGVLAYIVLLGVVWDGALVAIGLVSETAWRRRGRAGTSPVSVESMRAWRFFTCGLAPIAMLLATSLAILGTSNITLLSLKLIGTLTQWRDPFYWSIEGPLLMHLPRLAIDPAPWDRLYHSAWLLELLAAFALIVIGRGRRHLLGYCVSMIVLFYVGRLLGVFNPVMGPAFHRPDVFAYLDGSLTSKAMEKLAQVMSQPPETLERTSGILLGGVSAMPSLHIAMVALTAIWLGAVRRWTLFVTVPWVLLVWMSTVVLGWHYIVDGAAGLLLAAASALVTQYALARGRGARVGSRPRAS